MNIEDLTPTKTNKKNKLEILHWVTWFFASNILLFWLIGLRYLPSLSWLFQNEYLSILTNTDRFTLLVYLAFSYLGYLAVLLFIPFLLMSIVTLIFGNRLFSISLSIILATVSVCLLISDTIVYNLFHFHINYIILDLVINSAKNEQNFLNLSGFEIALGLVIVLLILILEYIFATFLENHFIKLRKQERQLGQEIQVQEIQKKPKIIYFAVFIILCLLIAYSVYIPSTINLYRGGAWADRSFNHALIEASRILPYFNNTLGWLLPSKQGKIALDRIFEHKIVQPPEATQALQYPLEPLQFNKTNQPFNLVMIVIDAWRFDMLTPDVTPTLYEFSKKAWVFNNHFSGGNATGPGIFSLFYGLPATYWTAMKVEHLGPVLIDALLKQNYQTNILVSAGLLLPNFKDSVFQKIKNLKLSIPGNDPYQRDINITENFKIFINNLPAKSQADTNAQPFFSFLFYDSSHSYCQINNDLMPFTPAIKTCNRFNLSNKTDPLPYLNRYKNSLLLVDTLIKQVLDTLRAQHLLENTVVIITGDHGEEFNDNKLGYFGHTSNFTKYQLQTPLIVYWPGDAPKTIDYQTSHYDIPVTLMEKLLGCQSKADLYSIGHSLLENKFSPYYLVSSYIGFGVVEENKDQIITVFPSGDFQITQLNGQPINETEHALDPKMMEDAWQVLKKFYK